MTRPGAGTSSCPRLPRRPRRSASAVAELPSSGPPVARRVPPAPALPPPTQPASRSDVRALLQRVRRASVLVAGETVASIGSGLLVLVGVGHDDDEPTAITLARRVTELRIFRDDEGRTNRSIIDIGGSALVVSQFTLYADTSRGRRPGFTTPPIPTWPSSSTCASPTAFGRLAWPTSRQAVRRRDGGRPRQRRPVHHLARFESAPVDPPRRSLGFRMLMGRQTRGQAGHRLRRCEMSCSLMSA